MIGVRLTDLDGVEHTLAVHAGRFVDPDEATEPIQWVDLRARWAVPGLADAHAHLAAESIEQMVHATGDDDATITRNVSAQLEGGVLLVADKGSRTDHALDVLDWPSTDRPELHMAGQVIAPAGGYYPEFQIDVAGSDLPAEVERACGTAAEWVKLIGDWPRKGVGAIPNYAEDELRSAVEVAHRHGRRIAIHTAAPETPSLAVAAGIDSIEHGLFLTEDDLRKLGSRGGAWVPTVVAMQGIADMLGPDSSGGRLFAQGLNNAAALLATAAGYGVTVLAGTDLYLPHGAVAREAVALSRRGLDHAAAVAAVTTNAYNYLRSQRAFAPGHVADVVAFAENPLDRLATLTDPSFVMRAGRIWRT